MRKITATGTHRLRDTKIPVVNGISSNASCCRLSHGNGVETGCEHVPRRSHFLPLPPTLPPRRLRRLSVYDARLLTHVSPRDVPRRDDDALLRLTLDARGDHRRNRGGESRPCA